MPGARICVHCQRALLCRPSSHQFTVSSAVRWPKNRYNSASRQMSWLSNIFASKSPPPSTEPQPPPPTSPAPPAPAPDLSAQSTKANPELKLKQALEKAAEKRQAILLTQQKQLEHQLLAWGESEIPSSDTSLPFQNPLGHLSLSDQKSYLANPPNEYIETLEERARVRETYEKELFLADPLTHWKFAYAQKPDFSTDILPTWQRWSPEKRLEVMEKYRRYDERFQSKMQAIYMSFDSPGNWEKAKASVILKIQRDSMASKQRKKSKPVKGKKVDVKGDVAEEVVEVPPLTVVERRAFRSVVRQRNEALNRLWHVHLAEVSAFEDLTQDGMTLTEDRRRKVPVVREQRNQENERIKKALKDWTTMPNESKAETVNWKAIYAETS